MIQRHPKAAKEYRDLPLPVRQQIDLIEAAISEEPRALEFVRRKEKGWGTRTMLVAEARMQRTEYRIAWEIWPDGGAFIWMCGAHEGFYARLARRAGQ